MDENITRALLSKSNEKLSSSFNLKYNNDVVQDKLIASIISFIYLYIIIFFVISALLTLTTTLSGS